MPTRQEDIEMAFNPESSRKVARKYGVEKSYVLQRRARHNPNGVWPSNGTEHSKSEVERLAEENDRLRVENGRLRAEKANVDFQLIHLQTELSNAAGRLRGHLPPELR